MSHVDALCRYLALIEAHHAHGGARLLDADRYVWQAWQVKIAEAWSEYIAAGGTHDEAVAAIQRRYEPWRNT